MNLHEKLFEIQKSCTYLQKNAQGYQYKYAAGTDVIAPVRAKMDELKVMLFPKVSASRADRGEAVDDKGKVKIQFFTEVSITFVWVNVEDPKDTIEIPWYGQGVDPAEKGVGKAWTYAERYFLLKFFHIPTDNDDPDRFQQKRVEAGKRTKRPPGNEPPPPPPPHTEAEPDRLKNGNHVPANPWFGHLVSITGPVSGNTAGKDWTYWTLSTGDMELLTFDKGVAEVAGLAIQDNLEVELVWKLKRSKRTGDEKCSAESIRILEASELDRQFSRAANY
jgi:hypothetical protein